MFQSQLFLLGLLARVASHSAQALFTAHLSSALVGLSAAALLTA